MSDDTPDTPDTIPASLLKAQKAIGAVFKSATNPFVKAKYVPVDEMVKHGKDALQKADLTFRTDGHTLASIEGGTWIRVEWVLEHKDGSCRCWASDWPVDMKKGGVGGALSEALKYELRGLLLAERSDDYESDAGRATTPGGGRAPRVPRPSSSGASRPKAKLGAEGEKAMLEAAEQVGVKEPEKTIRDHLVACGLDLVSLKGKPRTWPENVRETVREFLLAAAGE